MHRLARSFAATLLLLALPVTSALAQQQPSASHIEAAKQVVLASGIERSFEAVVPNMFEQVKQILVTRPELTQDMNEIIAKIEPEFIARKSEMVDAAAKIFAGQISEADLKEIAAFFTSPAGKRYVQSQPAVLQELFVQMQDWSQQLSAGVVERNRAEMRARGKEY